MAVTRIYFMLMAQDMHRAVAFYEGVFGLTCQFSTPFWSELGHGGAIVALHGGGNGARQETGLGLNVDDLDATCAAVTAAGGVVERGPERRPQERIRIATVRDPEGNTLSVAETIQD